MHKSSHQLAAIMFTDIVGYTALMGSDEDHAFEVLSKNKEIHQAIITNFNGTLIKEMGDGMLLSFPLASEAVKCAIEIQKTSKKEGIPLKIGIHEGEMVFAGEDVYGDGVNIASRLQGVVNEGCIAISEKVYSDIKNKPGINTKLIGTKKLKNVEDSVKVYEVLCEKSTKKDEEGANGTEKNKAQRRYIIFSGIFIVIIAAFLSWYFLPEQPAVELDKSIAVLPFVNMSNDPDQLYFSDGIMDAILNHLIKIKDLRVTPRTSVMQYRDTKKTIPQIARELGVAYVLEGGVQRYQDQVRINAQLIEVKSDKYVWSENYDREFTNIFAIQSEVAQQIANILQARIDPEIKEQLESKPTENMEAYNFYLEATFILSNLFDQTQFPKAYELLEKAIALDPDFALAYKMMAQYWVFQGFFTGTLEKEKVVKEVLPLLEKSLELDDKEPNTHEILAFVYLYYQWDFEKAEMEFNKIRELSPSYVIDPNYLLQSGRHQEALVESTKRTKNDMNNPYTWAIQGLCLYFADQPEESLATFEREIKSGFFSLMISPNDPVLLSEAGRVFIFLNEYHEALKILEPHLNKLDRRPPRDLGMLAIAYYKTDQNSKSNDILEELKQMSQESSSGSPAFYIAMLYAQMGEINLAFEWLEKAYQDHEVELVWLKVEPPFEPLRNDPRWQEMLDKVGFPD